jgi:hypothetical protein
LTRRYVLAAAILLIGSEAACGAASAAQFRCILDDGAMSFTHTDLGAKFPLSGARCAELTGPMVKSAPSQPVPVQPQFEPRWIVAPPHVVATDIAQLIRNTSRRYGVDEDLVHAVINAESRYRADARSPKGALGLMQIMPSTGLRYGITRTDALLNPVVNIDVGVRYLRDLQEMFDGRINLVVAAYNAGEAQVVRHGHRVPDFPETRAYVARVISSYREMRAQRRR